MLTHDQVATLRDISQSIAFADDRRAAVEQLSRRVCDEGPSAYWGDRKRWDTRANNHNSMFRRKRSVVMIPVRAAQERNTRYAAGSINLRRGARRARRMVTWKCTF